MKILIVDDDPVSRRVLKEIIAQEPGHQTTEAGGGDEAWALLDHPSRYFDIAFLDVSMPETDGMELLARIHELPILRSLLVVMCTASTDRETVAKVIRHGIRHYIVKPATAAVVLAKLRQIRAETQSEPAPRPRLAGIS